MNITLPSSFAADLGTATTGFLGTMSPFLTLVGGILLGVLVISVIISALK